MRLLSSTSMAAERCSRSDRRGPLLRATSIRSGAARTFSARARTAGGNVAEKTSVSMSTEERSTPRARRRSRGEQPIGFVEYERLDRREAKRVVGDEIQ